MTETQHPVWHDDPPCEGWYCRGAWRVSDAIGRTTCRSSEQVQRLYSRVKAFGAPGDYGYSTKEGQALFSLAKARRALTNVLADSPDGAA